MRKIDFFPESIRERSPKRLSEVPTIHPSCTVIDSEMGKWTELMANTSLVESTFGDYSYTAGNVSIIYSDIGKFSNIAAQVRINPGGHPMERVSQHHMLYRCTMYGFAAEDDVSFFDWRRASRSRVGHDTWIGHGATIMAGVTLGNGSVVGAGAVVTKDVAPYEIVAGVPAKPIRRRFPEAISEKLEAIAWWNWDHGTLAQRLKEFNDVASFVEKYGNE